MEGHGVIVKCTQLVEGTAEDLSCSGMYLGQGMVLTHGTLLIDLLRGEKAKPVIQQLTTRGYCVGTKGLPNVLNSVIKDAQARFQVILPAREYVKDRTDVCERSVSPGSAPTYFSMVNVDAHQKDMELQTPMARSASHQTVLAYLERLFIQPRIQECVASLMPASKGWRLVEEKQDYLSSDLESLILSTFVVLRLSDGDLAWVIDKEAAGSVTIEATKKMLSLSVPVHKGQFVYIESSPFGATSPHIFLNSLSHGIISNTSPKGGEVLLTDARCIMGSEGAPVFVIVEGQRHMCALVMTPFCWRNGEWLGLTLLASLDSVLRALLHTYIPSETRALSHSPDASVVDRSFGHPLSFAATEEQSTKDPLASQLSLEECVKDVSRSVVCVMCAGGWGSGLVISSSPGVILTCAHVTYKATNGEVDILLSDGRRKTGRVIHQTQPLTLCGEGSCTHHAGHSLWDLAVIVTSTPLHHALPLATQAPFQGMEVVATGYGMFPPQTLPSATLSRGVVSKVVTLPSSSLHLPSRPTAASHGRGHSPHANYSSNNCLFDPVHDDTVGKNTNDNLSNFCIKTNGEQNVDPASNSTGNKLDKFATPKSDRCVPVPVPVVMQTTCAIYAGSSGGPVVALHPTLGLQAVGLVVCNMQDSGSITFPHVNLAIPVPAIATILNTFLESKDKTMLKYLDVESEVSSHLWGLTHLAQSRL